MLTKESPKKTQPLFSLIVLFIAVHSFAVGLALIFIPASWIQYFGFIGYDNNFFRTMGGVFHLVMVVAYVFAYIAVKKNKQQYFGFIPFMIIAKSMACFYLTLYFLIINPMIFLLLTALADGLMGLIVLLFYRRLY